MNPLNVFKILFNCEIKNNELVLPNDFNLLSFDKRIRELTYQYFEEIENKIKLTKIKYKTKENEEKDEIIKISPLTFEDLALAISKDQDFPIIPNTILPEFYYNKGIALTKYFKFDADFLQSLNHNSNLKRIVPKYAVKYCFQNSGNEFWNINNYLECNAISIEEASKIKHASEVIDFNYLIKYPDLFDLQKI